MLVQLPKINPWQPGHPIVRWTTELSQAARARDVVFILAQGVRQVQKDPESELSDYLLSELLQVPPLYSASDDTSESPRRASGRRGPYAFMVIAEKLKAKLKEKPGWPA